MKLYCRIDLHLNNSVVVILDEADKAIYQKKLHNNLFSILQQLSVYYYVQVFYPLDLFTPKKSALFETCSGSEVSLFGKAPRIYSAYKTYWPEIQRNRYPAAVLKQSRLRTEFKKVLSVTGIGEIPGITIMLESGDMNRFAKVGNFSSFSSHELFVS